MTQKLNCLLEEASHEKTDRDRAGDCSRSTRGAHWSSGLTQSNHAAARHRKTTVSLLQKLARDRAIATVMTLGG